jgi:hypothetical protein
MVSIRDDFTSNIESTVLREQCSHARQEAWDKNPELKFLVGTKTLSKTTKQAKKSNKNKKKRARTSSDDSSSESSAEASDHSSDGSNKVQKQSKQASTTETSRLNKPEGSAQNQQILNQVQNHASQQNIMYKNQEGLPKINKTTYRLNLIFNIQQIANHYSFNSFSN